MRRYIIALLLCVFGLALSGTFVYAQAPLDVQQAAQKSLGGFVPTLNQEREHYGLTQTDPVETASLGEGYPYYRVSVPAVKAYESGNVPTLSQLYIPSGGYIFPIKVGNKQAGIAYVENVNGKWQVVQISSNLTLESDLASAKAKIKQILAVENLPSDTTLIYDQSFQISALQVHSSNGEFIMPLVQNDSLDLKKGELKPLKDHADKLQSAYKARISNEPTFSGSAANDAQTKTNSWDWPMIILALIIALGVIVLGWKKLSYKPTR